MLGVFYKLENGGMDTLDEIKYYCNEAIPAGALLLTGQWGCGKTYFVKNQVSEDLKNTHIFLHISLFGMASTEEVRNEVKKTWTDAWMERLTSVSEATGKATVVMKQVGKFINVIKDANPFTKQLAEVSNSVLSINLLDFVPFNTKIDDKEVVLVFDDLERSRVPVDELLGCINEYCENQHFHTVIIANEIKVSSSDDAKIPYSEMKEKIIQRTVPYMPDYQAITSSVINQLAKGYQKNANRYGKFLQSNSESICMLFSSHQVNDRSLDRVESGYQGYSEEDDIKDVNYYRVLYKSKPHNIRSLKAALQDFRRVFDVLTANDMTDKEKWLFCFVSYVLCYRAGSLMIPKGENKEKVAPDKYVEDLYIGYFNRRYMTGALRKWIEDGEWDEDKYKQDLNHIKNQNKAILPEDKVRLYSIMELEEEDLKEGFPKLLQKAYDGEIELDDYVNLIANSHCARESEIPIPVIDWNRINEGINKQIETLLQSNKDQPHFRKIIGDDSKQCFLEEEWKAYTIIKEFLNERKLTLNGNQKLYIEQMNEHPESAFLQCQNKYYDSFNTDMARATVCGFKLLKNEDKEYFISSFIHMWEGMKGVTNFKVQESLDGFRYLVDELQKYSKECESNSSTIANAHTRKFIMGVNELMQKYRT